MGEGVNKFQYKLTVVGVEKIGGGGGGFVARGSNALDCK